MERQCQKTLMHYIEKWAARDHCGTGNPKAYQARVDWIDYWTSFQVAVLDKKQWFSLRPVVLEIP
jgi:hypothetical protein